MKWVIAFCNKAPNSCGGSYYICNKAPNSCCGDYYTLQQGSQQLLRGLLHFAIRLPTVVAGAIAFCNKAPNSCGGSYYICNKAPNNFGGTIAFCGKAANIIPSSTNKISVNPFFSAEPVFYTIFCLYNYLVQNGYFFNYQSFVTFEIYKINAIHQVI